MRRTGRLVALIAISLLAGCGSTVVENEKASSAGAGAAGTGGEGGVSSAEIGASTSTGTPASSVGSTGEGGGSALECGKLSEGGCLKASPTCVTVYDDTCCSDCDPGNCGDCVNYEFHHCASMAEACAALGCGVVPAWVCAAQPPKCPGPDQKCTSEPGCVEAQCNLEEGPGCAPECHPVTTDTCLNQCDSVPPPCPPGTSAENDGFCYTGWCVPDSICGF